MRRTLSIKKIDCEELGHIGGARSRATAPPHRERSVKVARTSVLDASWTPSNRKEAQETVPDKLEGLCLSAGLGTPWAPSEELEEVSGEKEVWASLLSLLPADKVEVIKTDMAHLKITSLITV
ncbi:hypothetical protein GOODEAATRI_026527 [Goodea atripinnis]|uniref:Uncharacterized protein n=1 Tax=Goodea atripinnis TaxID=208336 RepID=A0ABV0NY37_9TELE